jgi:hypothetical protein
VLFDAPRLVRGGVDGQTCARAAVGEKLVELSYEPRIAVAVIESVRVTREEILQSEG